MIAHDPLHRSGRAALPHPAPALGKYAQSHEGIRMADTRNRKPPGDQSRHSVPGQMVSLAATAQHRPPQVTYSLAEGKQGRAIHRYAVVASVAIRPSASMPPVPQWACASVAAVPSSVPAAWLATSAASSAEAQ